MLGDVNYFFFFCLVANTSVLSDILPGAIIIANSYFNIYRPSVRLPLITHSAAAAHSPG